MTSVAGETHLSTRSLLPCSCVGPRCISLTTLAIGTNHSCTVLKGNSTLPNAIAIRVITLVSGSSFFNWDWCFAEEWM